MRENMEHRLIANKDIKGIYEGRSYKVFSLYNTNIEKVEMNDFSYIKKVGGKYYYDDIEIGYVNILNEDYNLADYFIRDFDIDHQFYRNYKIKEILKDGI